jgi:hypothetical protein
MKSTLALAVLGGTLAGAVTACVAQPRQNTSEQRVFGAEDESVKAPFTLPRPILAILAAEDEVKNALDNASIRSNKLPDSWFLASEVHLAGPAERDVIVIGRCPVCGTNIVPFWVFRPNGHGYQLIMSGGGLGLSVLRRRTNGYFDIQTGLVAEQKPWTGVWRFDGQLYQLGPDKKTHAADPE